MSVYVCVCVCARVCVRARFMRKYVENLRVCVYKIESIFRGIYRGRTLSTRLSNRETRRDRRAGHAARSWLLEFSYLRTGSPL